MDKIIVDDGLNQYEDDILAGRNFRFCQLLCVFKETSEVQQYTMCRQKIHTVFSHSNKDDEMDAFFASKLEMLSKVELILKSTKNSNQKNKNEF